MQNLSGTAFGLTREQPSRRRWSQRSACAGPTSPSPRTIEETPGRTVHTGCVSGAARESTGASNAPLGRLAQRSTRCNACSLRPVAARRARRNATWGRVRSASLRGAPPAALARCARSLGPPGGNDASRISRCRGQPESTTPRRRRAARAHRAPRRFHELRRGANLVRRRREPTFVKERQAADRNSHTARASARHAPDSTAPSARPRASPRAAG